MFNEQEGVVKYRLAHKNQPLAADIDLCGLNAWRSVLYRLQLIGQITERYAGLGFGNISRRLVPDSPAFVITGTQTGHLPSLSTHDFALIECASPSDNFIQSRGLSQPSSEALTHACVYQQQRSIQAVIHVHCPEIWQLSHALGLACTAADVPYGTPEMADAVAGLFGCGQLQTRGLFSMLGHEDGIVAFAATLAEAANLVIEQLAIAIEQNGLPPYNTGGY